MLKFRINDAKSHFFDRAIVDKLDKQAVKGLSKFGAYTRRAARSSMRKARQKTLAELTDDERKRFRIRQVEAKAQGAPRPKRPLASSKPGEPPRTIRGDIKKFLFFAYEPQARSVVIGPARTGTPTGAPENLEQGGFVSTKSGRVRIEPRPYMKPAFDKHTDQLPALLSGAA